MSNPFLKLKAKREARGISLEEAARLTKIDLKYLEALEKGEFDKLPDPIYVKGYIRTYARELGIDAIPLLRYYREFEKQLPSPLEIVEEDDKKPSLSRSKTASVGTRRKKKKVSKLSQWMKLPQSLSKKQRIGIFVVAGILLVSISGLTFWLVSDDSPSAAESAQTESDEKNQTTDSQQTTTSSTAEERPIVSLLKSSESYKYGDYYGVKNVDEVQVTIKANGSTYIRVRGGGPTGEILMAGDLAQGETKTFSHGDWLSVRIDHPDQAELSVNGVKIVTSEQKEISLYQFKKDDGSGSQEKLESEGNE